MNRKCEQAVEAKNAAEGSDEFERLRATCSSVLVEEYQSYIGKLKDKISKLSKISGALWLLNRELLDKKAKYLSIPPSRDGEAWAETSKAKADLFARTCDSKFKLPQEIVDSPYSGEPEVTNDLFIAFRSRCPRRNTSVDLESDCQRIAVPVTVLCRRLLHEACWPKVWRLHSICPLCKRGSAFQARNYRGVHSCL